MRTLIVGLGVQGHKRQKIAGPNFAGSVDPFNDKATFRSIEEVPDASYDAAIVCIPDEPKMEILRELIEREKHVLVEKPLWAEKDDDIFALQSLARERKIYCGTAYNHRFEPHFIRMRELIRSRSLGKLYSCRMFYGNGTARLVRDSEWRDQGAGVLPDLGSHLLDTARFWFDDIGDSLEVVSFNNFENKAPDHVVLQSSGTGPRLELEMTLLSWRNHFTCDLFAENGSAHISSLCKWGPSTFTHRTRVLPSGRPAEETVTLVQSDPTWQAEYDHFISACESGQETDLSNDLWLNRQLRDLSDDGLKEARS